MAISDNFIQNTYSERISNPTPGTIQTYDQVRTGTAEAAIPFGVVVGQGAVSDKGVVKGVGAGFLGISVRDVTLALGAALTVDSYNTNENAAYVQEGQVWVVTAAAAVAGGAVHYDATSGAISSSGGNTIAGARFVYSAAAGGRTLVELGANVGS